MFQSLVITLREGAEAALIVGIVLGYLKKTGRQAWNRFVYWGLVAAVAGSLIAALVVHHFEMTEESYEGWLMVAGAGIVTSIVYWMWRTGKRLKGEIESKLSRLSGAPARGAALATAGCRAPPLWRDLNRAVRASFSVDAPSFQRYLGFSS